MNREERWAHNVGIINAMDVAAGSVIKQLILDLESVRVHITLTHPTSHSVAWKYVHGTKSLIATVSKELGVKISSGMFTVPS